MEISFWFSACNPFFYLQRNFETCIMTMLNMTFEQLKADLNIKYNVECFIPLVIIIWVYDKYLEP